jgi:hypothetical protein
VLDNCDIAILVKVNELIERHGIPACDVVVSAGTDLDGRYKLTFEATGDTPHSNAVVDRVMSCIGIPSGQSTLYGTEQSVYRTLSDAVRAAPLPRARRR